MTEKQLQASRSNLAKRRAGFTEDGIRRLREAALRRQPWRYSTGPRTDAGKLKVRTNALKHGRRARLIEPFSSANALAIRLMNLSYLEAKKLVVLIQRRDQLRAENFLGARAAYSALRDIDRRSRSERHKRWLAWRRFGRTLGIEVSPAMARQLTNDGWWELARDKALKGVASNGLRPELLASMLVLNGLLDSRGIQSLAGHWDGRWRLRKKKREPKSRLLAS